MKAVAYSKTILPHRQMKLPHRQTILPHRQMKLPHRQTILPHLQMKLPHAETILPHAETIPAYLFTAKMCGSAAPVCAETILPLTPKGQLSLVKIPHCVRNDRLYIEFGKRD